MRMLSVPVFLATFLVSFSVLVLVSALYMVLFKFSDRYAQGILINNLVNTANNIIGLLAAMPGALVTYATNHVAATLLFGACVFLHIELDYNEGKFLQESQTVYYDLHQIWVQGIVVPLGAVVGALYASLVPIYNYVSYVPTAGLFGTLQVLAECGNPTVLVTAIADAFVAVSQMFMALITALGRDGSWLSSPLDLSHALMHLQTKTVQPLVDEMDCLCEFIAPTVSLVSNVVTSRNLALAISALVNTGWRAWQVPAQLASERFQNHLDVGPVFDEMRDACYYVGMLLDDTMETTLNWVQLQTKLGSSLEIPKPSLGTGIARQVSAVLSVAEIPLRTFAAIVGVSGDTLWNALSFRTVATQSHLGVLDLAVGVNTLQHLLTGQGPSLDTEGTLKCDFYDYDFFSDYNVYGSISKDCRCEDGDCINGNCVAGKTKCQCDAHYVPFNVTDPISPCVESCATRPQDKKCQVNDSPVTFGTCLSSGLCACDSGYHLDSRSNYCVPTSTPVPPEPAGTCGGTGRLQAETGPPLACMVQSAGLAAVGLAYTVANAGRLLAVDILSSTKLVWPWTMMQTIDGMWYPRMQSVTCEYRKLDAVKDPTIDPANCKCTIDPLDRQGRTFDPYCAQPTLNANVYSHMDALAYYSGGPILEDDNVWFLGGMGFYRTFLNDNVGVFATNAVRAATEVVRVSTHAAAALVTYATTLFEGTNWLQLPVNCGDWGSPYGTFGTRFVGEPHYAANASAADCAEALKLYKAAPTVSRKEWPSAVAFTCAPSGERQPVLAMNEAYLKHAAAVRYNDVQSAGCKQRAYKQGALECSAPKTNDDASCVCSIDLPYNASTAQCQAIAWFPALDVEEEDLHGYFNNPAMASFYHQDMPWANAMIFEWLYYRGMEAAVAVNNFFARLDSSDLTSYEFDSPCYEDDPTNQYTIGDTTSVVKIFQRPAGGTSSTFRTVTGTAPPGIVNQTICAALQGGGTVQGKAMAPAQPRWIRFDSSGGYPCKQGCWQNTKVSTTGVRIFLDPGGGLDDMDDFRNASLPPPLNPDTVDPVGVAKQWIEFVKYAKSKPSGTYNPDATKPSTIWQLTDRAFMLHPETCSAVHYSENMIFQPCMHTCRTTFGIDRCWCNVTVPTDFVCNAGQVLRQASWGVVSHARRASTAVISLLGDIPAGAVYNLPLGYCDLSRVIGTACGAVASLLTVDQRSASFAEARRRLASLFFAVADTAFIMPLSMLGDKAQDIAAKMKLAQAAELNMYQSMFEDLIEPGSGGGSLGQDEASVLGEAVANYFWHGLKFECVVTCNMLDGLQKVIFGTSTSATGSTLIPAVEDFVDMIIQLLDETYTSIITLVVQVGSGFWGLLMHNNPSIGEWFTDAVTLVLKVFGIIDANEVKMFSLMINLLPKSVQTIVTALMVGMCYATQYPAALVVGGVNDLIKTACFGACGGAIKNTFKDNLETCKAFSSHGMPTDLSNVSPNDETYGRRLQENASYPEQYAHFREELDWNGTTLCARYGRHDVAPDNEDLWRVCVERRVLLKRLRQALQRDDLPWTLFDDWSEPVAFAAKVAHGSIIDLIHGREQLLKWQQVGYPVHMSSDIVAWFRGLSFPTWDGAAEGLAGAIPAMSPDYKTNRNSIGYSMLHILSAARRKSFPNLLSLPWAAFDRATRSSFKNISQSVYFPTMEGLRTQHEQRRSPAPAPTPHRRLGEALYDTIGGTDSPTPVPGNTCDEDEQPVCTKCRVLDVFINDIVNISRATYTYYNDKTYGYQEQMNYALHATAMYNAIARANNASISAFGNPGTNWQYPVSPSTAFMEQAVPKHKLTVPVNTSLLTKDAVIKFFKTTTDAPVPFFKHGFWWYLKYPLRSCDTVQMAYKSCRAPEYSMEDALTLTIYIFILLLAWGWLTGLALPWFVMIPVLFFSFMLLRYDYVPRCLPLLPVCLVSDIEYLLSDSKACLCEVVPALVIKPEYCIPNNCALSNERVTYRSCPRDELGIFDSTLLVMRWQMPEVFQFLFAHDSSPFGTLRNVYPVIKQYTTEISDGDEITELQKTCARLGLFDVITVIIGMHILLNAAVPLSKAAADTAISAAAAISEGSSQLGSWRTLARRAGSTDRSR